MCEIHSYTLFILEMKMYFFYTVVNMKRHEGLVNPEMQSVGVQKTKTLVGLEKSSIFMGQKRFIFGKWENGQIPYEKNDNKQDINDHKFLTALSVIVMPFRANLITLAGMRFHIDLPFHIQDNDLFSVIEQIVITKGFINLIIVFPNLAY